MWKKKIDNDPISEKYRKYIIGINYNKELQYALWGTDTLTSDEEDKLWLNQNCEIILFRSIKSLRSSILNHKYIEFDVYNFLNWAKYHTNKQAYIIYNFDHIKSIITCIDGLKSLSSEDCMEVVGFINLFGDYANQVKQEPLLILHQKKEIEVFFDYAYDNYVWDDPENADFRSLNELDYLRFNEKQFRETIQQMLNAFMSNTVIWEE